MPNNSERPFGRHTVKLHAAFVPEGAEDKVSHADVAAAVGSRALKIPAVLVPEGGPSPGHPYVSVGEFEFRPDDNDVTNQQSPSFPVRPPEVRRPGGSE